MSSTLSATGKVEKQTSKFKGIDINTIYKGSSSSPPKTAPTSRQHGLQVLGKVQSIRRMPPPANLPSLKSQSGGTDQNVNLIPTGTTSGGGWSAAKEDKTSKSLTASTTTSGTTTSVAQKSLQQQQAGGLSSSYHHHHHHHLLHLQMENVLTHSHTSQGEGGILWSDVTSGGRRNYLDRKSFSLQEDFPELCAGGEEKNSGPSKKEDASKDQPFGPGPSLRPQNVASWRDGGGKGIAQQPPQSPQSHSPSPQRPSSEDGQCAGPPYQQVPSDGSRPPGVPPPMMRMAHPPMPFMGGPMPMIPPYPPRPPHMMMMPPPYAFRTGFHPPPPYPPNFIPPGMPRHAFMGPEFGMRPRMPLPPQGPPLSPTASFSSGSAPEGKERPAMLRSSVIKERDLEQFDRLEIPEGSGWARSSVNVDYSEKLVFSDDEDAVDDPGPTGNKSKPCHASDNGQHQAYKWSSSGPVERGWSEEERGKRSKQEDEFVHSSSSTSFRTDKQHSERSVTEQRPNSVGVLPGDGSDMYPNTPYPGPYGRHPPPYNRQWPGGPMYDRRYMLPYGQMGAPGSDADDDEKWHERQVQHNQEMTSAIERARQRREEEERKLMEDQKNASMLKLKQLDEKNNAKRAAANEKERGHVDGGERCGTGDADEKDAPGRQLSSESKSPLVTPINKPVPTSSATSVGSNGAKFLKSHSQQSVDRQSAPDVIERPDSSPCPPSGKQSAQNVPMNPSAYPGGITPRMPPPQSSFGYWGAPYDPRWGSIPLPPPAYAMEQARFRMKGHLEHSGSLDDLHQGSMISKRPLPAPPQPHNYYQYHPQSYQPSDPYEVIRYMGEYKDVHQKGSYAERQRDGEKSRSRFKTNSGSDDAGYRNDEDAETDSYNAEYSSYSGPRKVMHHSSQQPSSSDPPQRKTILHRNKSESERSEDRPVLNTINRERMCSTSSGVSSKGGVEDHHEMENKDFGDTRPRKTSSFLDSYQENQKSIKKYEENDADYEDDCNYYKAKQNGRQEHTPQQSVKQKTDQRDETRRFTSSKDESGQLVDNNDDDSQQFNRKKLQQQPQQHKESQQHQNKHQQQVSSEDGSHKKQSSGKETSEKELGENVDPHRGNTVDYDEFDDKKNEYNRTKNINSPRTQERRPKPKERQIYQHQQQWSRSTCPPPISMDKAEQNRPNTSSYTSLKKQQPNNLCTPTNAASTTGKPSNGVINRKDFEQQKARQNDFELERKSMSKESLKPDKKGDAEETESNHRYENRGEKRTTAHDNEECDRKEGRKQRRPDRDQYYYDKGSYWKGDIEDYSHERDGREYYYKRDGRDYIGGKSVRGGRGGRSDDPFNNKENKVLRNYKSNNNGEDYQGKESNHNPSRDDRYEGKEKFYYNSREKDAGYHGGGSRNNKRNNRGHGKGQDQSKDAQGEEAIEKNVKREIESDGKTNAAASSNKQPVKDDKSQENKSGEGTLKKVDAGSLDNLSNKQAGGGGRSRMYRGGRRRDFMDSGEYHADESKYRPQGSREFVRGGSKNYGGGRGGRDHQRARGYIDEEDDEWEDERVMGGRGGRYPMRSGPGRRNPGRRSKVGGKESGVQDFGDRQHKKVEGKKSSLKDTLSAEDLNGLKKSTEAGCISKSVASSTEGIPSLMSKNIPPPPTMAKLPPSLQMLSDGREDKQQFTTSNESQHGKAAGRNVGSENDQDKNKDEKPSQQQQQQHGNSGTQPRQVPLLTSASSATATSTTSSVHKQSHYHRSHHHYPVNNYDRRPRSSRGPIGGGHKTAGERNKLPSAATGTSTPSNNTTSNVGSGKDKKQPPTDIHTEEWETASEGSEVTTGGSMQKHHLNDSARQQVKDSNGENSSSSNKKSYGGQRPADKNTRSHVGGGFRNSNKIFQGDETPMHGRTYKTGVECDAQHIMSTDKSASTAGKNFANNSINNANKMVEGSSGDGNGGSCVSSGCGDNVGVDSFPSTVGDAGGKESHIYYLHEVQYDNQDIVSKFLDRARRNWLMKVIDPWSSSLSTSKPSSP